MKKGNIYSLTSYFTVEEVKSNGNVVLVNSNKTQKVEASQRALNEAFVSGDSFSKEEKLSKTEINKLILDSPRTVMTVNFDKIDTRKTNKKFNEEKIALIADIKSKIVNSKITLDDALLHLANNPVQEIIPGENRTIRGYHFGELDVNGRLQFIDMEQVDSNGQFVAKQVTTANVKYIILNNIKYIVK